MKRDTSETTCLPVLTLRVVHWAGLACKKRPVAPGYHSVGVLVGACTGIKLAIALRWPSEPLCCNSRLFSASTAFCLVEFCWFHVHKYHKKWQCRIPCQASWTVAWILMVQLWGILWSSNVLYDVTRQICYGRTTIAQSQLWTTSHTLCVHCKLMVTRSSWAFLVQHMLANLGIFVWKILLRAYEHVDLFTQRENTLGCSFKILVVTHKCNKVNISQGRDLEVKM